MRPTQTASPLFQSESCVRVACLDAGPFPLACSAVAYQSIDALGINPVACINSIGIIMSLVVTVVALWPYRTLKRLEEPEKKVS